MIATTEKYAGAAPDVKVTNTSAARYRVAIDGVSRPYWKTDKAYDAAKREARRRNERVRVLDVVTGEFHELTPTGRVIDGHSVPVGEARQPWRYRTIGGFSAANQHRVNRTRVLVEGSRCTVQGERGKVFVFDRIVRNGDKVWAEVREVVRLPDGTESVCQFRAFRPERLRTARGWN